MKLPIDFLKKMNKLLSASEYESFIKSYENKRFYGIRINTLKISVHNFIEISPFKLRPIPWSKDGFYIDEGENPGKHPFYYAGLYYIQEPSAMLPSEVLNALPGDKVLDLCAAPGGKSLQIAASLKGEGLLISNDINSDRVKALVKNIELGGTKNAVVTNASPEQLINNFTEYFDKILVDAPCSGEGMFRKDERAIKSWEKFQCEKSSSLQKEILMCADKLLKPEGLLVYSTCTFSPEENEENIAFMIEKNNYTLLEIEKKAGIENGIPLLSSTCEELTKCARLWPHKVDGEGHFVALLKKSGLSSKINCDRFTEISNCENPNYSVFHSNILSTGIIFSKDEKITCTVGSKQIEIFNEFAQQNLNINFDKTKFILRGKNLYYLNCELPDLSGIKIAKFGWYLGEFSNEKFEPSHSFVLSLKKSEIQKTIDFEANSIEISKYLKGETLVLEGEKGFTGVCVNGYTVGWAKQTGEMLKNLYPKGWRKLV